MAHHGGLEEVMFAVDHAATALLIERRFPSVSMTPLLLSVQAMELAWAARTIRCRARRRPRPPAKCGRHSSGLHALLAFRRYGHGRSARDLVGPSSAGSAGRPSVGPWPSESSRTWFSTSRRTLPTWPCGRVRHFAWASGCTAARRQWRSSSNCCTACCAGRSIVGAALLSVLVAGNLADMSFFFPESRARSNSSRVVRCSS